MDIHNIHKIFHNEIRNFSYNICFLELLERFPKDSRNEFHHENMPVEF